MSERKSPSRISNAEIKAGVFLTFCLALFIAMLFVLGKFGRIWRGREEINVVFTQVNAMRPDAQVLYNGMEIGHVRQIKIVRADEELLGRLPVFGPKELSNLPVTDAERETLKALSDPVELNRQARALILGRTVVMLVLEVLRESDTQRFHTDDQYRISGNIMGTGNVVDIRTGSAQAVPPNYDKAFLGISGDMYTDLGKSISQVKDILGSMAEIVGGEGTRDTIRGQLDNFDNYTGRLESVSGSVQAKMPAMWNSIDERIGRAQETFGDIQEKLNKIKPKVEEALVSAQKAVIETRDSVAKSVDEAREKVKSMRAEVGDIQGDWRKIAAEYRETIPAQVKNAREWTDRFGPTVDKIDNFFSRADDQLNKGGESTRAMLAELLEKAAEFEAKTYRLAKWPSSFANAPSEEAEANQDAQWRRNLARRQFIELRNELDRVREGLDNTQASDHPRVARIGQIIRETDASFDLERAATETQKPPKKGKK